MDGPVFLQRERPAYAHLRPWAQIHQPTHVTISFVAEHWWIWGQDWQASSNRILKDMNEGMQNLKEIQDLENIKEEIKSILKDFHYNSDTENMSKDVVIALENLVKS